MSAEEWQERSRRRARWMAEVQRGDADAYGALLNDIGPMVANFLRPRVPDAEDAQDLYQEILLALHRARHTYDPTRPLEPWLFAITRRLVADHRRRRVARGVREVLVQSPPEVPVESDGHMKLQLEQALDGLSPAQREALSLLRIEGLSIERAAVRAGTTPGALKVRAHRAYKMLLRLL